MRKNYFIVTYGCQMNVHESEKIAGILVEKGYEACEKAEQADVVVFNTCCIRESAETHAYGNIGALKKLKKLNKNLIVAVGGCMTEQQGAKEKLLKTFPYVDIVFGANNPNEFKFLLEKRLKLSHDEKDNRELFLRTSYPNAWINIVYGCNNFCSYCIVPYVKGRERSRAEEDILNEVDSVLIQGYKEITLLGQNVNSYGKDGKNTSFSELIDKICQKHADKKFRLRFMSNHPKDINEELIKTVAKYPQVCPSIHFPLQSGSSSILSKMNRKYSREDYLQKIHMIRSIIPDCTITTDIIVGFPGETEEDFLETCDLVEKVGFSGAFTFVYSRRSGTVANDMPDQISKEVKKQRITKLVALQNLLTKSQTKSYLGKIVEILVEGYDEKRGYYLGRDTYNRMGYVKSDKNLIGEFIKMKVERVNGVSLFGQIVTQEENL